MKYTQNEKLNQLDFSTLVVGVDVGSEFHYARAFDFRGIELSGVFKISNDAAGFEAYEKWKHELMEKHDKSRSIVGMEPAGHYWFNFGYAVVNIRSIFINAVNTFSFVPETFQHLVFHIELQDSLLLICE